MLPTTQLDDYFQDLEHRDLYSGVVLVTQGEQPLYAAAYGYANRAWQIRNTLNTRFNTASITKLFTAIATLQLIDQGRLEFTTGVIDLLDLKDTAISKEVNIFHLLTHTSGIGDDADEEAGESYADLWKTRSNYLVTTTTDFLPQFIHKPSNFAPGQGCRYCNVGYILLGLVIEKITGLPYRDYVRQHIFAPAGMTDTDFFWLDRANPRVADGYDPIRDAQGNITGWQSNIYSFPPIGSPDAGAYVTAADLVRFMTAVRAGDLLSPVLTAAFLTPQVHYRDRDGWTQQFGYGLWFHVDGDGQVVCYQKEGINAGVSGLIRHFPASNINVVLLSNMEEGVWQPIRKLHAMVVAGEFAPSLR